MYVCLVTQWYSTLQTHGLWPTRLLCPWDSPGKNTGVGCHFLLQGIFLTQGSKPGQANSVTSEPPMCVCVCECVCVYVYICVYVCVSESLCYVAIINMTL